MSEWIRFYKLDEVCPLCGHDDACSISSDGITICCCRTKSDKLIGIPFAGGYLHPAGKVYNRELLDKKFKEMFSRRKLTKNWVVLNNFYRKNILHSDKSNCLATEWNVPSSLLLNSGLGWDGEAYTIPMYNDFLNIVGIQRRFPDGTKRMVEGSKLGVFIGWNIDRWPEQGRSPFIICEGYSDTITASSYGYYAIGRPSCGTGIEDTLNMLKLLNRNNVVIVADPDEVGQWGAELLLKTLSEKDIKSSIILPPNTIKDLRDWHSKGLTKEQFDEQIRITNS